MVSGGSPPRAMGQGTHRVSMPVRHAPAKSPPLFSSQQMRQLCQSVETELHFQLFPRPLFLSPAITGIWLEVLGNPRCLVAPEASFQVSGERQRKMASMPRQGTSHWKTGSKRQKPFLSSTHYILRAGPGSGTEEVSDQYFLVGLMLSFTLRLPWSRTMVKPMALIIVEALWKPLFKDITDHHHSRRV